ncbi:MAG TPA: hypothetical protein VFS43_38915 [Polyangiaceae bacterium]|nr:hypothetical protein [Polyangiaceae bacterium]
MRGREVTGALGALGALGREVAGALGALALGAALAAGCGDDGDDGGGPADAHQHAGGAAGAAAVEGGGGGGGGGGGAAGALAPWDALGLPRNAAGDVTVPAEVRDYMQRRAWGYAHDRWHKERLWDMQSEALRAQYLADGFRPFDKRAQGVRGSGLEFLAMHRHMFRELRERFPAYGELWRGWPQVPRERQSPLVPVAARTDLSADALTAIDRLESDAGLAGFATEDELGLYIWTNRYVAADAIGPLTPPVAQNADPSAGVHDTTLHQRWGNTRSDVNLAEFSLTHENYIFWKMHGWIDDRWTRWRQVKGLPETDAALEAVVAAQGAEMHESEAVKSEEVRAELEAGGHAGGGH